MADEITREDENEAFDKLFDKVQRIHPSNRAADPVVMPKLKFSEWMAIRQFYRRNAH